MRRDPLRTTLEEATRRATLATRNPAAQSPPGDAADQAGAPSRIDPATWQTQHFGLLDVTPLNEGPSGGFVLS